MSETGAESTEVERGLERLSTVPLPSPLGRKRGKTGKTEEKQREEEKRRGRGSTTQEEQGE